MAIIIIDESLFILNSTVVFKLVFCSHNKRNKLLAN